MKDIGYSCLASSSPPSPGWEPFVLYDNVIYPLRVCAHVSTGVVVKEGGLPLTEMWFAVTELSWKTAYSPGSTCVLT